MYHLALATATAIAIAIATAAAVAHYCGYRSLSARRTLSTRRRPIVVVIDGGIAVGKSTLCARLAEMGYRVYTEGADDDARWAAPLRLFYEDPRRWCLTLQAAILADMRTIHDRAMREAQPDEIVFVERCPSSALTFVANSRRAGHLSDVEFATYSRLHDMLGWHPDYIVALRLPADEAIARMRRRNRAAEGNVDAAYVRRISELYVGTVGRWRREVAERAVPTRRVYSVDASPPPDRVLARIGSIVRDIRRQRHRQQQQHYY